MPPQQTGGIPASHRRALIPSSRVEFHLQRRYAAAFFAGLQAWKVSDLLYVYTAAYPEQQSGVLAKWLLIDTCYLIALFIAQIPWLQFTLVKTIFLSILLAFSNITLFAAPAVSFCSFFRISK